MRMGRFYRGKAGPATGARPYPRTDITPAQVDYWLDRLGIASLRDKYPGQISGGQRQRTAIARSLVQSPVLLLMDEPFSSLDALTREDLQRLTLELRQETGVTTVVVTHDIEEAVYLGRRILLLPQPAGSSPILIENLDAGTAGYRSQPAYFECCTAVRATLEGKQE
jgi:ABC-type nitrate/sulfonate/bicarbonate transport system ATPase subunit